MQRTTRSADPPPARRAARLAGALAVLCAAAALPGAAEAVTLTQTLDRTFPLAADGRVELDNVNGGVTVDSWDRPEVRVQAVKKAKALDREDAARALREVRIEISRSGDRRLRIETEPSRSGGGFLSWLVDRKGQASVAYHLTVPRGVDLEASTVNGRLDLDGVEGRLRLSTVNGSIHARDLAGAVRASTVNGAIEAEMRRVPDGADLALHTTNGGIDLALPADVRASVEVSTTNGSVASDFPLERTGRWGPKRMHGDLNGGGGRIRLETTNGGVAIREL